MSTASKARLSQRADLVDLLPAVVWQADLQRRRFSYVSQSVEELLGYPVRRWLEESGFWADHIHAADQGRTVSLFTDKSIQELPHALEYRFLAADGRILWLRDTVRVSLEAGRPTSVYGVIVDATAHKLTEDALRKMVEDHEALYNRTPIMMHSIDRQGRLVSVSDHWLRTLGYARSEVLGRRSLEFLSPESRERAQKEVLPEFFRTGFCEDVPYELLRKGGGRVEVLLSATCERDEKGEVVRSLAVMVDVTERRQAEEALRRAEEQLRQAQKMEAVGRLAGGIAHDFNNLLVAILGHSDMLLDSVSEPSLRSHIDGIRHAGERAAALTRQILGFSRKQPASRQVIDFDHLVVDTERMLRRILREDIEVVTELGPSGNVQADPAQLAQVLLNLATNAGAAMPSGGRLTIRTRIVDPEDDDAPVELPVGRYVLLTVQDTGTGMDAAIKAHIFEPFFTTKEPGAGTGLGLSTVYGIVKQTGGAISVESEPGRGTTFRIHLPCVDERAAVKAESAAQLPRGSGTVLVAEDSALVRKLLEALLRGGGYAPLIAGAPEEAIAMARAHAAPIDVLLTDVVMPGMRGPALADRIVALHPEVHVIFMSGYTAEGAETIEGRDFLAKPFTAQELLGKLAQVLAS